MTVDRGASGFHDDQRRARRRSIVFVVAAVGILLAIANLIALLTGQHYSHCGATASLDCTARVAFSPSTFAVTVYLVAGYLVVAYVFSTRAALQLANAHEGSAEQQARLRPLMEQVCIASGQPMPRLWVIEDDTPNALAAGTSPERATVAVTTGMLDRLSDRELRGVLAHEMSHVRNRDMSLATVCVIIVATLTFLATISAAIGWGLTASGAQANKRDDKDGAGQMVLGVIVMLFALVVYVLAVPASVLLRAAVSRKRELLADATAVEILHEPTGLRSALEKLEAATDSRIETKPAIAHLWIRAPHIKRAGRKVPLLDRLLDSHPPIAKRIAILRQYEGLDPAGRGPND